MEKYVRRRQRSEAETTKRKLTRRETLTTVTPELGDGTPRNPYHLPLRQAPNATGCTHCPEAACECQWMAAQLNACYTKLSCKRETVRYRRSHLCAKSILPVFVSRLVRLAKLTKDDVFYDLGCGNGSVLFQVALLAGCRCVGVEINPANAHVAEEARKALLPRLEEHCGRKLDIQIISADLCKLLADESFLSHSCVIWAANLLLPDAVNQYLAERLRSTTSGTRIFCFKDLYPHARECARTRDPDAFQRFHMVDYTWQPSSVEWCALEGSFFEYVRR